MHSRTNEKSWRGLEPTSLRTPAERWETPLLEYLIKWLRRGAGLPERVRCLSVCRLVCENDRFEAAAVFLESGVWRQADTASAPRVLPDGIRDFVWDCCIFQPENDDFAYVLNIQSSFYGMILTS